MTHSRTGDYRRTLTEVELDGLRYSNPTAAQILADGWALDYFVPLTQYQRWADTPTIADGVATWSAIPLPIADIASIKRAEIEYAKDAAITDVIGTDSGIHRALGEAIELVEKAGTVGLSAEEIATVDAAKLARAYGEAMNAKRAALIAAIDQAEAAGDVATLTAITWETPV
jgi:hypothetical protein